MEPKYYTPEIEEFHVGFECQMKDVAPPEDDWKDEIISIFHKPEELLKWLNAEEIRVKALDREDIEACGWKHDDLNYFKLGQYHLLWINDKVKIWIEDTVNTKQVQMSLFWGTIRNKSELKMIMRMVGIKP